MKIWIDTTSGTWGEVDGDQGRLMIVDLATADALPDGRVLSVDALEEMSDSQVAWVGDSYGHLAR